MKKTDKSKYFYAGVTALAVLMAGLAMIFVIFKKKELAAGLNTLLDILQPFFIGSVIAYLLAPLCNNYEKLLNKLLPEKGWKKRVVPAVAVGLSAVTALIIVAVLLGLIVPSTINSLISLILSIPDFVMDFIGWSNEKLTDYPEIKKYLLNMVDNVYDKFDSWTQTQLMPSLQTLLNGVGSSISMIINLVLNVVIGFIVAVYLLSSRKVFARQAKMLLYALFRPKAADLIYEETKYADKMFSGFLRGKVLDSAIVGVICFVALKIMNFPDVMLISVIVGVTNIIPFFGPFIGAIPSALLILVTDPKKCVYFIIFIFILQQFDGNILGPKCMGSSTNLSAFWILFSILLFGGLWGFVGMVIAVPLFAVIYDIARKLVYYMLRKHGKGKLAGEEFEGEDNAGPVTENDAPQQSAVPAEASENP